MRATKKAKSKSWVELLGEERRGNESEFGRAGGNENRTQVSLKSHRTSRGKVPERGGR